jgi:hypothetical protein
MKLRSLILLLSLLAIPATAGLLGSWWSAAGAARRGAVVGVTATGGTITNYTEGGTNFTAHIFTTSSSIVFFASQAIELLLVGGGGSGGNGYWGGGGGGGGVLVTTLTASASTYSVTVGSGGYYANRTTQTHTPATASWFSNIVFAGRGGTGGNIDGGINPANGHNGASGAGFGNWYYAGTNSYGTAQGYPGGNSSFASNGGGGGGAGSPGTNATSTVSGNGGVGRLCSFSGTNAYYGGGGGGGAQTSGETKGVGGLGGGGDGGQYTTAPTAGKPNTGGGGGGAGDSSTVVAGGSGIVIVRYARP